MPPATLMPTAGYASLPLLDSGSPSRPPALPELIGRGLRRRTLLGEVPQPPQTKRHLDSGSLPTSQSSQTSPQPKKRWRPWHLSPLVMVANIVILVVIAITLEVLLRVNRDAYGWRTPSYYNHYPQIHIAWTVLPGLIAFLFVQQWFEVDRYIKLLQPYIDMSRDRVPAEKSVLLNYPNKSKWLVWVKMLQNKHITPLLSNSLAILAVIIPPLFSSYLYLQQPPDSFMQLLPNITVLEQLGPYTGVPYSFTDAAAGFMKASSRYSISPPPFIRFLPGAAWTATRVAVRQIPQEGIVRVQAVCLKSIVSCEVVASPLYNTTTSKISGSTPNCSFASFYTYSNTNDSSLLSGMSPANCPSSRASNTLETSAVAFWIMETTEGDSPVATVCIPKMTVQRADVLLNSTTSALISVNNQQPLLKSDQIGIDMQSAPFNGSAYNGLFFGSLDYEAAINSTREALGQAIATLYSSNSTGVARSERLRLVTTDAYAHYLALVAPSLYFLSPANATTTGSLHPTSERLFISSVATHVLFVALLVMAIIGTFVTILHHRAARYLVLTTEPGTLAAAIALAGLSDIAHILDSKDTPEEMQAMLADLHFAIDPNTGRLYVEESEQGYSEIPSTFILHSRKSRSSPDNSSSSSGTATYLYAPAGTAELSQL